MTPPLMNCANAVDRLPLALASIAAAFKKRPRLAPETFLLNLQERGLIATAERAKESEYVGKLNIVLDWHWEQLAPNADDDDYTAEIKGNARQFLSLAAAYAEAAQVPLPRLRYLTGIEDDPDGFDDYFSDGIQELFKAALAEDLDGKSYPLTPADSRLCAPKNRPPSHFVSRQ